MRNISLLLVCCLLLASATFAQTKRYTRPVVQGAPTTCGADPVLPSDGSDNPPWGDQVFAATSAFYTLNVKAGHSYAVEVWDVLDQTAGVMPAINLYDAGCNPIGAPTDVTTYDPDLSGGFSRRVSWRQGADQTIHIEVMNPDPNNPYIYEIRATDTTLFNPRWVTSGGYNTQWGMNNTTSATIKGTLTVVDHTGVTVATREVDLPPGLTTFVQASDIGVPASYGNATYAYEGPPGAVQGDAYYLKTGITIPSLFAPKHAYH